MNVRGVWRSVLTWLLPAAMALCSDLDAKAADAGAVTGQFVLKGDIPTLVPLIKQGDPTAKDATVCAAQNIPSDKLVVDESTKGIANIFIYLPSADVKKLKLPPAALASAEKEVVFDQKGCRFIPHCLLVNTDQTVIVKSDDAVSHNTHTNPLRNTAFNQILGMNDRKGIPVKNGIAENLPTEVKCDIHPWMQAYWLILDHPFAAITDATGHFKIENLPPGDYVFRVWQERVGYVDRMFKVKIEAGKTTEIPPVAVPVERFDLK